MSVTTNIQRILADLPSTTRLVAVSKFHPNEAILQAFHAGQRVFGESRAQELKMKHESLPQDIEWHFIGTLQTNKIKYIIPYVALIHGIDSFRLLVEVNKQAAKAGRKVKCLLQFHIAQEETKFGFTAEECTAMLENENWKDLDHVEICGLMGMASNTENAEQIRQEFRSLNMQFSKIKQKYFADETGFCELSMGMSDDYLIAIEEGSTLIRVGSNIFGSRTY